MRIWSIRKSFTMLPEVQNGTQVLEIIDKKLNIHLPIWPSNPNPGETKTYTPLRKKTCTRISIAAFIIAPN